MASKAWYEWKGYEAANFEEEDFQIKECESWILWVMCSSKQNRVIFAKSGSTPKVEKLQLVHTNVSIMSLLLMISLERYGFIFWRINQMCLLLSRSRLVEDLNRKLDKFED